MTAMEEHAAIIKFRTARLSLGTPSACTPAARRNALAAPSTLSNGLSNSTDGHCSCIAEMERISFVPGIRQISFGPLASIYRVKDRDEAITIANQTSFGLSSAIWSTDAEEQNFFTEKLDAGAVFVNGMTISYPELAFGGVKDSGFGRELGAPGIREFTNMKTIWKG